MMPYHHSGTSRYFAISLACTSGSSFTDFRACAQICRRKRSTVCTIVAVIDAKLRPYATANVVERYSGLYLRYACSSNNTPSSYETTRRTSYGLPKWSYASREEIGMYCAPQTLEKCSAGVRIQKKITNPAATFAAA